MPLGGAKLVDLVRENFPRLHIVARARNVSHWVELRKREIRREHAELMQRRPAEPWPIERPGVDEGVLDARRKLTVLSEEVLGGRMPAHSEAIIAGLAEGRSQPEIARGLGVSERVVHHNVAALRERFTERLVQLGMLPPPVEAGGDR